MEYSIFIFQLFPVSTHYATFGQIYFNFSKYTMITKMFDLMRQKLTEQHLTLCVFLQISAEITAKYIRFRGGTCPSPLRGVKIVWVKNNVELI